jgi:hypothetical protein
MPADGSGQLSLLADRVRKMATAKNKNRRSARGWGKLATGTTGAKQFQGRNSQADLGKEQQTLQSPIMQSFLQSSTPQTPITDMLKR